MASRDAWADAYYMQARSDWDVFKKLHGRDDIPRSHALHYLQMASEKLAKAYRFRDTSAEVRALLTSHVGFARFLNTFLLSPQMREEYRGRDAQLTSVRKEAEKLAREVERLAPGVARRGSPGNAEYPWQQGDAILIPATYPFPQLSLLREAGGRRFLKLMDRAFQEFAPRDPVPGTSGIRS